MESTSHFPCKKNKKEHKNKYGIVQITTTYKGLIDNVGSNGDIKWMVKESTEKSQWIMN